MVFAALEIEQPTREILSLQHFGASIHWVDPAGAHETTSPLIITGITAMEKGDLLRPILSSRMRGGLGTLLIPRFKPGDLAYVLETPSAVEVVPAETACLNWDGVQYRVPGSVLFRTKLHVGRWAAQEGKGVQLLAYRPTTASGRVILCSASIGSHRPGAVPEDQEQLLRRLKGACEAVGAPGGTDPESDVESGSGRKESPNQSELSPTELLLAFPEQAPGFLLAILTGTSKLDTEGIVARARDLISVMLPRGAVSLMANRLSGSNEEIESALNGAGWAPFIRKIRLRINEENS